MSSLTYFVINNAKVIRDLMDKSPGICRRSSTSKSQSL